MMAQADKSGFVIDMSPAAETISTATAGVVALENTLYYGLLAIVIFGPLAFGATLYWAQFVQRIAALALLAIWAIRHYLSGSIEVVRSSIELPAIIFVTFVASQFVTGLTSYRYDTLSNTLDLIPCGVLLLVGSELFSHRHHLHRFASAMAVFGFAVAIFALVQDLSNSDKIYGIVKVQAISAVIYGPYANHNHYAGLMEMLAPLAGAAAFLEHGAKRTLLLFATVIMALTVVFSRSRGGMLGLAAAVVFLCVLLYRTHREHRPALVILALSAVVLGLVLFLGNDKILHRITETQDNYRLAIYGDCLRMWLHKPLLGFGYGTFSSVYPQYRSFHTTLRVNHAHNDYLELLVETGLAGVLIAGWFLFSVFREGFRKTFDGSDYEGRVLALGIMTGVVALLVHSALDFNLHIPANAALFYLLCAALATPFKHRIRQVAFTSSDDNDGLAFAVDELG